MRIHIKTGKMRFIVPLPNFLLKFGISIMNTQIVQRQIPPESRKYITPEILMSLSNCIELLKKYKGLEIINVSSKDGTFVRIIL